MLRSHRQRGKRQPPDWVLTILLLTLMVLAFQIEHLADLHVDSIGILGFNLLPVLIGIAWLKPGQELILGATNLGLLLLESSRDSESILENRPLLISRILTLALCIWITSLRNDSDRQRRELTFKAETLTTTLDSCLRASALAHEIRQPLSVILLSSQLLEKKLALMEEPDPDCQQHLLQMVACAKQLNITISSMGALMRSVKTEHTPVDLATVVQSSLLSLQPWIQSGSTELSTSGLDLPLLLRGDAEQLRIACGNLLSNALEAMETLPPTERRLLVRLERRDRHAWLTVADSGGGLPEKPIELLTLHSNKAGGMGLGLFIVQTIAKHHGGDLLTGRSNELGGAELRLKLSDCY